MPQGRRIGYCRTSTRDQDLDHQIKLLQAEGCDPILTEQLSGKNRRRPQLDHALSMLRPGDALVVTRLSRLSRSVRDLIDITDEIKAKGADFLVTQQDIDTTTAAGRFMFTILAAVAEFEREMIAENTRDGMAAARDRGSQIGSPRKLTEDQARALREAYAAGAPVDHLCAEFGVSVGTFYNYLRRTDTALRKPQHGTHTNRKGLTIRHDSRQTGL